MRGKLSFTYQCSRSETTCLHTMLSSAAVSVVLLQVC